MLVFGLRYNAVMPMRRINVVMSLRPTVQPSALSRSHNMRALANGSSRCSSSMCRISLRSASPIGSLSHSQYTEPRLMPTVSAWRVIGKG